MDSYFTTLGGPCSGRRSRLAEEAMKYGIIVLIVIAMLSMAACQFAPKKQAVFEDGAPAWTQVNPDGTVEPSREKIDPATGEEREPFEVYDAEKIDAQGRAIVSTVGGLIPAPFGTYFSIAGNAGLALLLAFVGYLNRKKMGLAKELVKSIEDAKSEDVVVIEEIKQSDEVKKFVDSVQAEMAKA